MVTPTSSVSLPGLCRDRRFCFLSPWRKSFWLAIEEKRLVGGAAGSGPHATLGLTSQVDSQRPHLERR